MKLTAYEKDSALDVIDEMRRTGHKTKKAQLELLAYILLILTGTESQEKETK